MYVDSLRLFSYLRSFTTILDACLGRSSTDRPKTCDQPLFLPFRGDQPIEYEPIQWQNEPSSTSRFVVQPTSPSRVLQARNEPNNDTQANNNTNIILLDDNDDQNYVDANGDEENEAPKVTKKKGKKKKQPAKVIEQNDDTTMQLNTSSNRTSTTGQKPQVKSFVLYSSCVFNGRSFLAKIIIEMVKWKTYIWFWYGKNQCCS